MRKTLLPMVASLALCGAATVALVATNARAEQQSTRKPVMIALVTPTSGRAMAAPPAESGPTPEPADNVMMAPRREQLCRDLYAGRVGELAYLEAKLSLDAKQAPLFARWKQANLDIAKQHEADCAGKGARHAGPRGQRLSVVDRLTLEEDLLKRRLADIQAERPALQALYGVLTPAQKEELMRGDMHRMAGRMHMMVGMMDRPRGNRGFMRQRLMGGPNGPTPPEPPPPAQ